MKNKWLGMIRISKVVCFLLLFIVFGGLKTNASHIVGMDLKYLHDTGSTYTIFCTVYGDCGSASRTAFNTLYTASPNIYIYDGDTKVNCITLHIVPPDSGKNIAKYVMCAADTDSTTCNNIAYTYPGVTKFVFSGSYYVPHASHYWRFICDGYMGTSTSAGRAAAITNISGSSTVQLEDTLDNTVGNNSNANLSVEPILFFCNDNPDSYSPIGIDPDGDSLVFELMPAISGSGYACSSGVGAYSSVTYNSGYTYDNPISVSPGGFSFNSVTGEIDFRPNMVQRATVDYNIREFRHGVFIGSSQREMNFIVQTCTVLPPSATITGASSTGHISTDSLQINVCQNSGPVSFTISARETDTNNLVGVTVIGMPVGATKTVSSDSTNHPRILINWNTTGVAPGAYPVYLKLQDNACPVNGERLVAFTINVVAPPVITGIDSVCEGGTTLLAATPTGGIWTSQSYWVASIGSSGLVSGLTSGVTKIFYSDATGACKDSVRVFVNPIAPITGVRDLCLGATETIADALPGGWWGTSNTDVYVSPGGVVTALSAGTCAIRYVLPTGCFTSATINVLTKPVISGPDSFCQGRTVLFTSTVGSLTWISSNSHVASIDSTTGTCTSLNPGAFSVFGTAGNNCADTLNVFVKPGPNPIVGNPNVCLYTYDTLHESATGGTWSYTNINAHPFGPGIFKGADIGVDTIFYTMPGGCRDTFLLTIAPLPVISGNDTGCMHYTNIVNAAPGGGLWSVGSSTVASIAPTGYSTASVLALSPGNVTITYHTPAGCTTTMNYKIFADAVNTIAISDSPSLQQCFGTPVWFFATDTGGGAHALLQWTVNGSNMATGDSFLYTPSNGDIVQCILNADTVCPYPQVNTSNKIVAPVNMIIPHPHFVIKSTFGDTSCFGELNTFYIDSAVDTGYLPRILWSYNLTVLDSNVTRFTSTTFNGDIVTCTIDVATPCAIPDPAVVSDTIIMDSLHTPGLTLWAVNPVCFGQPITIYPVPVWGGWMPSYSWYLNGSAVATGNSYNFMPTNGDTVKCIMTSNYPCPTPTDTAQNEMGIVVDPVIIVNITASPGALVSYGEQDTFFANVTDAGYSPSYQWYINGIIVPGETRSYFTTNSLVNKDSVSCQVVTGFNTPCEDIKGHNWMIVEVAPLGVNPVSRQSGSVAIVPNPNDGVFHIYGIPKDAGNVALSLYDVLGRLVYRAELTDYGAESVPSFDLRKFLNSGTYVAQISGAEFTTTLRISVSK